MSKTLQIKVLVVDDEPLGRSRLVRLLKPFTSIEVLGTAENGEVALEMIDQLSPNLILLDMQMPGMTGLETASEIMRRFADDPPAIIFCTAHDEFALEAFKVNAADYLLKPISSVDLEEAIRRACQVSQLHRPDATDELKYISIKHVNYIEKLPIDDVIYFRSEDKFVIAGLEDEKEIVIDLTLKDLEKNYFSSLIRVHRNSLLSRKKLTKLVRDESGDFVSLNGSKRVFQVSRRMLNDVKKCFD